MLNKKEWLFTYIFLSYVCSRFFIFDPPGEGNALITPDAPAALKEKELELAHKEPKVNPWFCMVFLMITVAIMAVTAEFVFKRNFYPVWHLCFNHLLDTARR